MPRYQLKDRCLFCDAYVYDEPNRRPSNKKPDALPFPHILDQRSDPATYLRLNDAAAFIVRFIVLGVDTNIIPQIVQSEYPGGGGSPANEVATVVAMIADYLEDRTYQRPHQPPQALGHAQHPGGYNLDFSVNWFGIGGLLKGPV